MKPFTPQLTIYIGKDTLRMAGPADTALFLRVTDTAATVDHLYNSWAVKVTTDVAFNTGSQVITKNLYTDRTLEFGSTWNQYISYLNVFNTNISFYAGSNTITVTASHIPNFNSTDLATTSKSFTVDVPVRFIPPDNSRNGQKLSIGEGISQEFKFQTNLYSGSVFNYEFSGIDAARVEGGKLSGTGTVSNGIATVSFRALNNNQLDGNKDVYLSMTAPSRNLFSWEGPTSFVLLDTSKPDPTYVLTSAMTAVDEGSTNELSLQTTNLLSGTKLGYTISGIAANRLLTESQTGIVTIGANGQALINLGIKANRFTDGASTAVVTIGNNLASASFAVNDTSLTPVINPNYSFTGLPTTYNEGSTGSITLQTTGVTTGTVLTYVISGITSDRLSNGLLIGSTTVGSNGLALINLDVKANNRTDGPAVAVITVGNNLASTQVTILDTSLSPTQMLSPTYEFGMHLGAMTEGFARTLSLNTKNIPVGTVLNYTISGITADRLSNGVLAGTTTVSANGEALITLDVIANNRIDGNATAVIIVGNNLASTQLTILDSSVITGTASPTFTTTNSIAIPTNSLTVSSTAANDLINGTTSIDTVLYGGSFRDYRVAKDVNGNYSVIDSVSSRNGSDVVVNVERLKFSPDATTGANRIALDLSPAQATGKAALLIGAVLPGKLALDPSKYQLMGAVIDLFDQGYSLQALSGALLRLPIWDILTGKPNPSNADIATYLVNNVYGVTSQSSNLGADLARSLAIQSMNAETPATQGTFLATLAASTTSQSHIDLVGIQSTGLVYLG